MFQHNFYVSGLECRGTKQKCSLIIKTGEQKTDTIADAIDIIKPIDMATNLDNFILITKKINREPTD